MLPLSLKALFEFLHIQQTFAAKAVVQLELLKRVESPEASSTYIAADGACEWKCYIWFLCLNSAENNVTIV